MPCQEILNWEKNEEELRVRYDEVKYIWIAGISRPKRWPQMLDLLRHCVGRQAP